MNKKIFGINIGSILSAFLCLVAAVLFWLFVKYTENSDVTSQAFNVFSFISRG